MTTKHRMNDAQELALRRLCQNYGVEFHHEDYIVFGPDSFMLPGWVEGWIGGYTDQGPAKTIYVGVSPTGDVNS